MARRRRPRPSAGLCVVSGQSRTGTPYPQGARVIGRGRITDPRERQRTNAEPEPVVSASYPNLLATVAALIGPARAAAAPGGGWRCGDRGIASAWRRLATAPTRRWRPSLDGRPAHHAPPGAAAPPGDYPVPASSRVLADVARSSAHHPVSAGRTAAGSGHGNLLGGADDADGGGRAGGVDVEVAEGDGQSQLPGGPEVGGKLAAGAGGIRAVALNRGVAGGDLE